MALRWKDGDGWGELTFAEYADRACRVATGLAGLGIGRGDRVVLMMANRPEFHVADMAILLLGGTPISIYNSSAPEQVLYMASHSGAKAAILEDVDYLERFLKVRDELPALSEIVVIEDPDGRAPADVHHWGALLGADPVDLDTASETARPDDLATVIYTSGTTGPPKGVMIDHENVCWTVESLRLCIEHIEPAGRRMVSYLPMAHIAERMNSHYQQAVLGYEVTTCPQAGQIGSYLPAVRPEIFFAVPRVWEKIFASVQLYLSADPETERKAATALEIGGEAAAHRARGEELPDALRADYEKAEAEMLRPARELLGLDQIITAITGAAFIPPEIFNFFRALGVPLSEVYGLSESSGPMTWDPFAVRPGTTGRAIPGCEVRARRGRRGDLSGRQRVPRLPQRARQDRRGARRRRLAPLGRHRRDRRRRLPEDRRPQEGAHHHRRREEHLAREPRSGAEVVPAHRSGVRDRRGPAVHLRAHRARPGGRARRGRSSVASTRRRWRC